MLTSLWVTEALGKTEVDNVDIVLFLSNSNQKVVWLDVSVQEVTRMNEFNALKLNKDKLERSQQPNSLN